MKTRDPDELLIDINRSTMLKGLLVAFVIHAAIILGTSFGLYSDWWGLGTDANGEPKKARGFLKTPSAINYEKQLERRAVEEEARKAAVEEKLKENAAKAQEAAEKAAKDGGGARPASRNDDLDGPATTNRKDPAEEERLPPKASFDLNDIGGI